MQITDQHIPFLLSKAQRASGYFEQHSTTAIIPRPDRSLSVQYPQEIIEQLIEAFKENPNNRSKAIGKAAERVALMKYNVISLDDLIHNRKLIAGRANFVIFDNAGGDGVSSVKAKGIHLLGEDIAVFKFTSSGQGGYINAFHDIIGKGKKLHLFEEAAKLLLEAKEQGIIPIPEGMKDIRTVEEMETYLRNQSKLLVPDEYVTSVREILEKKIRGIPGNFDLPSTPTEEEIKTLLDRVEPIGVTLYEIEKQYEIYEDN